MDVYIQGVPLYMYTATRVPLYPYTSLRGALVFHNKSSMLFQRYKWISRVIILLPLLKKTKYDGN